MTMTSWPYVDVDTTDIEYGRLYREMAATDGVVGSLGDNTLSLYANSTGMTVRMRSGSAILRGYMFYSTAEEVLTVEAADSTARVDRVVLELNLSAPTIAERIKPRVLRGVAGSSNPPVITQTDTGVFQISLATISVGASATSIAAAAVTDDRSWTDQKVGAWATDARRPSSPRKYKLGYNESRGGYEFWNGAAWKDLGAVSLTSSLVTGILPISKGGTGAATQMAALNALGVYVQAAEPAYADNRVWIKIP